MTIAAGLLKPGDVVVMSSVRLPNVGEFKAAVERISVDEFSVFSIDLTKLLLTPEDLTFRIDGTDCEIFSRCEAVIAVPQESEGFHQGDFLRAKSLNSRGEHLEGWLVAALDGLVYCVTVEGLDFTAANHYLEKVENSPGRL